LRGTDGRSAAPRSGREDAAGVAVLRLLLIVGVLLTVSGALIALWTAQTPGQRAASQVLAALLTSAGGAIVGAALSVTVSDFASRNAVEKISQLITSNSESRFLSEETSLAPLRSRWHHYHLTIADDQRISRYRTLDFSTAPGLGTLTARSQTLDPSGELHRYSFELGARGRRMILIQERLEGQEEVIVDVYPDMLAGFRTIHCGVSFLQDWDSNHLATRAILSRDVLIESTQPGTVSQDEAARLDETWDKEFRRVNRVMFGPEPAADNFGPAIDNGGRVS
jgi:hypothetical protein